LRLVIVAALLGIPDKNICRYDFDARRDRFMERRDAIIVGGRVLDFDGDLDLPAFADVFIENGRISAVGEAAGQNAMKLARGLRAATDQTASVTSQGTTDKK
jgi:hypothetical protein